MRLPIKPGMLTGKLAGELLFSSPVPLVFSPLLVRVSVVCRFSSGAERAGVDDEGEIERERVVRNSIVYNEQEQMLPSL